MNWDLNYRSVCLVFSLIYLLHQSNGQSDNTGIYTIVAPRTIRPNSRYNVGISVNAKTPVKVLVYLTATINSRVASNSNEERVIEPGTSSLVTLAVGDLIAGASYNLTVQGTEGLRFQNSTELTTNTKTASILIETDKPIYKPGETLRFRILLLDRLLRPYGPGPIDILIKDAQKNIIKKWIGAVTQRGVFSSELLLSEEPNLGDWAIEVSFKLQTETQFFTIGEYVLPKFNVEIELPTYATFNESKIVARIRANYVYGKAVKGELVVSAYPSIHSSYIQPVFNGISRKTVPIDGVADVEFDLTKELGLNDDYQRLVNVEATVRESLTSRMQNASKSIVLHKYKYKLEIVSGSAGFKPGLPYKLTLKIATQDDVPVKDPSPKALLIKHGYSYSHEEYESNYYAIPSSGLVTLSFNSPTNSSAIVLGMEATYKDLTEWFPTVQRALSPSDTYLQAELISTRTPRVNDEVEIQIQSTVKFSSLTYQLLGRGDLALSRLLSFNPPTDKTIIRIRVPTLGAPRALLVVYIVEKGEIVADSVEFLVRGAVENFLNLTLGAKEVEPGADIELNLVAKPNSYVGLRGIDQSVLLLKEDKGVSLSSVEKELRSWDWSSERDGTNRLKRSLFAPPGSTTAAQVFEDSGVIIMTNALVHDQPPAVYYRANFLDDQAINPEAEADSSGGLFSEAGIRTRKFFPESFLWEELTTSVDGKAVLKRKVPDTITSWILSGFSLDSNFGLGVLETPDRLRVFRPFFISLNLPYSVVRGETVGVQVLVHNYLGRDISAEVTLDNNGNLFSFTTDENEVERKLELFRTERVNVKPNSVSSVSFLITPTKIGLLDLNVRARTRLAGDSLTRPLKVRPPGQVQKVNNATLLDLRSGRPLSVNLTTKFPARRVAESDNVKISFVADLLGPAISNLNELLELPTGCGEQTLSHFVPDIVVLEYLQATKQVNEAVREKAIKYLESGYQRMLSYKHPDGSFSAFGTADSSGSTFLTAFVLRSFVSAKRHIYIDKDVILKAADWLISKQERNGAFSEQGRIFDSGIQGSNVGEVSLSAYVTLALVEAEADRDLELRANGKFSLSKNIAMDYLVKELQGLEDPYGISIICYLLQLSSHPFRENVFSILESKAVVSDDSDKKHWEREKSAIDLKNPWTVNPKPVAVETTAYALLSYVHKNLIADAVPLVRWLLAQRNERGGFISTQDTVVALSALGKFAAISRTSSPDMTIEVSHPAGSHTVKINSLNSVVLEEIKLPPNTPWVKLNAVGTGLGLAQLSWSYNVEVTGPWPLFSLDPQVDKTSTSSQLHLSICTHATEEESNMAIMEVNVPTGYALNTDKLQNLLHYTQIKRYETEDADSKLFVYFNSLNKTDVCPTVSAYRVFPIAKQAPAYISVYDYYDNSRRARQFYTAPKTVICDICEEAQCSEECRVARQKQVEEFQLQRERSDGSPEGISSAINTRISQITILLSIFNYLRLIYN